MHGAGFNIATEGKPAADIKKGNVMAPIRPPGCELPRVYEYDDVRMLLNRLR